MTDRLRKLIASELEKEKPDWVAVEAASRALVATDEGRVRFTIDAGHVQRLGMELVSKPETALSELIKNSYDADATSVDLTFENAGAEHGTLTITDNGQGMTEDEIRNSWMRISTNSKANEPKSTRYGRQRAGRKGIGRFSAQRLGKQLILESYPVGKEEALRVRFDWDADFTSGRDILDVFSKIERFDNTTDKSGVVLRIEGLRDAWPTKNLDRVWRSVMLLQAPQGVASVTPSVEVNGEDPDPGFQAVINGISQGSMKDLISMESRFLSQALATITAGIREDGTAWAKVDSPKLNLAEETEIEGEFLVAGSVSLNAHYFIYQRDTLSGMKMQEAAEMGRSYGGIRVYRNGFRVLPYGEPSNDWLKLDIDSQRREFLFPAANRNFFGHVSLNQIDNPLFEETSSREGLLENEAFSELQKFARAAILWVANRLTEVRNRKSYADQKGFKAIEPPSVTIASLAQKLEKENASRPLIEALAVVQHKAVLYEEDQREERERSLEYEQMLRLLASLGISISVFGHEIKGTKELIAANLKLLRRRIDTLEDGPTKERLTAATTELSDATGRLFDIGGYISGLISSTESRQLQELSVPGSVKRFADQFSQYMASQNVSFDVVVKEMDLRTSPMHRSELDAVLLNFLTNSVKSMKRAKVKDRKVKLDAASRDRFIVFGFEDNGTGVGPEIRDRIFNAFFTTTTMNDDDGVAGPGTGLGLKIVSDIASSYGGSVGLAEPSSGYTCRFEFKILAA